MQEKLIRGEQIPKRVRGTPPSFNQLEWDAKEIVVTAMAWDGSAFAPSRTWRLPRRQDTRNPETAPDPGVAGQKEKAAV